MKKQKNRQNFIKCFNCNKTVTSGVNRSHSMRATKRKIFPNLQKAIVDGHKKIICTRCLKTMNK